MPELPLNNLAKTPDVLILNDSDSGAKALQDDKFILESELSKTPLHSTVGASMLTSMSSPVPVSQSVRGHRRHHKRVPFNFMPKEAALSLRLTPL